MHLAAGQLTLTGSSRHCRCARARQQTCGRCWPHCVLLARRMAVTRWTRSLWTPSACSTSSLTESQWLVLQIGHLPPVPVLYAVYRSGM